MEIIRIPTIVNFGYVTFLLLSFNKQSFICRFFSVSLWLFFFNPTYWLLSITIICYQKWRQKTLCFGTTRWCFLILWTWRYQISSFMDNILWQTPKFKNRTKFSFRYCIENRNYLETLVGCGKILEEIKLSTSPLPV